MGKRSVERYAASFIELGALRAPPPSTENSVRRLAHREAMRLAGVKGSADLSASVPRNRCARRAPLSVGVGEADLRANRTSLRDAKFSVYFFATDPDKLKKILFLFFMK